MGFYGRANVLAINASHLFRNDIVEFCDSDCEQMVDLHCVLCWFDMVSGLRFNLAKSSILSVGQVDNIPFLASILGCTIDSFPTSYLGLPLGVR